MSDSEDKPVVNGLVALVAVAVVVGLLAGLAALIGTKVLGVGGGGGGSGESAAGESLVMPKPVKTTRASDPLVTLVPDDVESESASEKPSEKPSVKKTRKPKREISLSQGAFQVSPGEDLYLSGIYPRGEGAVLDIEISVDGGPWADFPVDVNVSDATFGTYVNTSQSGTIEWRVVDRSRKVTSNSVKVTYG